jgi:hypothetical protein
MDDGRGMFRLGVVITALSVLVLFPLVTAPIDDVPPWLWLVLGGLGATGIGLLFRARFARVLGVLLLLACGGLAQMSLVGVLGGLQFIDVDRMVLLSIANAIATTLLLIWMCLRGIQMLLGRSRASRVTPRLVGGALALVAAHHLWWASEVGFAWTGSWSIRISPEGTSFVGFPYWPLWHVALLVVALVMLAAPRRMLGQATTALMLLFASLVPLVIVAAIWTDFFVVAQLPILGMMLIPVYLCWWLSDELRRAERDELGVTAGA